MGLDPELSVIRLRRVEWEVPQAVIHGENCDILTQVVRLFALESDFRDHSYHPQTNLSHGERDGWVDEFKIGGKGIYQAVL